MNVGVAKARKRLTQIIRAFENGEPVVITRNGKPVAQLAPPPPERRKVIFGGMKDKIKLLPGWDDPIEQRVFKVCESPAVGRPFSSLTPRRLRVYKAKI